MKYFSVFVVFFLSFGQVGAFSPSSSLVTFLDAKVETYQANIKEQGEQFRVKLLTALEQIAVLAPANNYWGLEEDRFVFIISYLRDQMQLSQTKKTLTTSDFADNYEGFEIVEYPSTIVAAVLNNGPLGQTNDDSFNNLADFIFGNNSGSQEIAMTSPVTRTQLNESTYETAFIMPSGWSIDSLPSPNNERITIKTLPGSLKAVRRFSGRVNKEKVDAERDSFKEDLLSQGVDRYGLPTLSQYDGPRVSASKRRNELWVELNETY